MNNFSGQFEDGLAQLEDDLAHKKVSKGEGTGPISRILSNVNLLVLVFLLVTLFKAQLYWPALLILVLGFTRFGHWVSIGLLVYFAIIQYWPGVIILLIFGAIGWVSVWYGMRNVKKNLFSERAQVEPFEGMPDLLFLQIFQMVFFALALLTSGILSLVFWILFGLVTLFEVLRFYYRLASPWRRLHYSLIMRYVAVAANRVNIVEKENKEFDIDTALNEFAKVIYPNWTDEAILKFLETIEEKMNSFSDGDTLRALFKSNTHMDDEKIEGLLKKIQEYFRKKSPRWIIAEIIERDYGIKE